MKDIPRNEEEVGGRRRIFREEMIKRAEETHSFRMTKRSLNNNRFDERKSMFLSPTSSSHQSKIDIKVRNCKNL